MDARLEFKNALQIDSKFAEGYYMLGMSELRQRNLKKAFANLSKAVELEPEMLDAFKLSELVRYYHVVNFHFMPFWLGMNKNAWNKLPEDIQKILQDEAAKIPAWADAYHVEAAVRALEFAKKQYGLEVVEIEEEEIAKWRSLQDPIQQEYIDKLKTKKGIDAQKIFDTLNDLYRKYDQ